MGKRSLFTVLLDPRHDLFSFWGYILKNDHQKTSKYLPIERAYLESYWDLFTGLLDQVASTALSTTGMKSSNSEPPKLFLMRYFCRRRYKENYFNNHSILKNVSD